MVLTRKQNNWTQLEGGSEPFFKDLFLKMQTWLSIMLIAIVQHEISFSTWGNCIESGSGRWILKSTKIASGTFLIDWRTSMMTRSQTATQHRRRYAMHAPAPGNVWWSIHEDRLKAISTVCVWIACRIIQTRIPSTGLSTLQDTCMITLAASDTASRPGTSVLWGVVTEIHTVRNPEWTRKENLDCIMVLIPCPEIFPSDLCPFLFICAATMLMASLLVFQSAVDTYNARYSWAMNRWIHVWSITC